MTGRPDGEPRSTAGDGTQRDPETFPTAGGGSSEGSPPAVGGDQDPGAPIPPYEGRRSSGAVEEGGADREGAHVGGATGPQVASAPADDPDATSLGRTASPADGNDEVDAAEYAPDPGVGPGHQSGTRRGEDQPR